LPATRPPSTLPVEGAKPMGRLRISPSRRSFGPSGDAAAA
jgi:hypothetical protein